MSVQGLHFKKWFWIYRTSHDIRGHMSSLYSIFIRLVWFFTFFCLHWVFLCVHRLSPAAVSWGYSAVVHVGLPFLWLLLSPSTGSRALRLQQLRHTGSVALRHVGSSRTRDWISVLCIDRQILNHWTTREVHFFYKGNFRLVFIKFTVSSLEF